MTAREQARAAVALESRKAIVYYDGRNYADVVSDVWEPLLREAFDLAWNLAEWTYRSNAEIPRLERELLSRLQKALG